MLTTINISLPKKMYTDAKKVVETRGYSSISELLRDCLRDLLYSTRTVNGFTPEFEEEVLKSTKAPLEDDIILKTDKDY